MEWILPNIPTDMPHAAYYICVGLGVFIIALSKGGFGGGIGLVAIPLLANVMEPNYMLGVLLPVLIICDVFSNLHYLKDYDYKHLLWLLPGAALGIGGGTAILFGMGKMPPEQMQAVMNGMIGFMCLAVVGMQVYRMTGHELPTLPVHPASGVSVGVAAGACSTLNHSAGPIIMVYLLQYKLPKRKFVATMLLYFMIGNMMKLPTYLLLKVGDRTLINSDTLHDSIWFLPLLPLGTVTGAWLHKRIPEKPFVAIMYVAAAVAAAKLLLKAFGITLF